ncbi:hypothetical protein PYW08_016427 [Mythimna loreyi]|uniref:Uncharacterized protein n=1 Tax=Mythimna loreyi TaxID=667449 RepID=A0ACC2QZF3_9NEOP|nr:hypothetical protein PYW08_016427 [Mythimna loreyi]
MIKWTFFMFSVSVVSSYNQSTLSHCLWHNNTCVESCPEWMIQTISNCSLSYWPAQKTCDHPEETLVGTVCGFSRCDCPDTTVLDTETGICYDVDNCPTRHHIL